LTNAEKCEYWIRQYADSARRQHSGKRPTGGIMIRAGKICCGCLAPLPVPHTTGIKRCERCKLPPTHSVYMSFIHRDNWHCRFLEWDLITPFPRQLEFRDSAKIYETAERGHGLLDDASRLALDHAIKIGRGQISLNLNGEQYRTLKNSKNVRRTGNQGDIQNGK